MGKYLLNVESKSIRIGREGPEPCQRRARGCLSDGQMQYSRFNLSRCIRYTHSIPIVSPDVAMQIPYEFRYVGPHVDGHTYLHSYHVPQLRERIRQRKRHGPFRRRPRERVTHPCIKHYKPSIRLRHEEPAPRVSPNLPQSHGRPNLQGNISCRKVHRRYRNDKPNYPKSKRPRDMPETFLMLVRRPDNL
ncbi:hypothetical protein Ac2012v2_003899 [Leucoagaricus gongylophorus]